MSGTPWTTEQQAYLRKAWADGMSANIIADATGRTRNAIIGKVHRMGLPGRKTLVRRPPVSGWHLHRRARPKGHKQWVDWALRRRVIAEIQARDGTAADAAQRLGMTVEAVLKASAKLGMRFPPRNGYALYGHRKPGGGPKRKRAPRDRKSVKGVSQAPWRAPVAEETSAYEAKRRAGGAMRFIDTPNAGRCKWFLADESGKDGLQCCASIPAGSPYCPHHRALAYRPYTSRRLEAAE